MSGKINEIIDFISHFSGSETTFLYGCCYWFARILEERFIMTYHTKILYEPVEGHFITAIAKNTEPVRYYDIRGDVTELYAGMELYTPEWLRDNEPNWYRHIMRDCRDFIDTDDNDMEVSA